MKKLILLVLFVPVIASLHAQKKLPAFGVIDIADLKLQICSFDPAGPAMKLFDVQDIEFYIFSNAFKLQTERRVRIKIFNAKGYEHANIKVPYFSKRGVAKIKLLRAIIYNLDESGKIVSQELTKKDFFKQKAMDNLGMVNFTFPGLKPGSVIEFSYTRIENNFTRIMPWLVQDQIPVAYTSTSILTPIAARIEKKLWGLDSIQHTTELLRAGNFRKTTFFKENIYSFSPEPFMSSFNDNLMKVSFMLIPISNFFIDFITSKPESVWRFVGNQLLTSNDFGGQIKKKIQGTQPVIDSAKAIHSIRDRIFFLYETVRKRIPEKGEQTFIPGNLDEAWSSRAANTAEANLILINLMQHAGISAFPLLVSTRENGKVNMQYPNVGQMNGVDVLAADSTSVYILDASIKHQSPQSPPANVINRNGYLLHNKEMRWILVDDNRPLIRQITHVQASLNVEGKVEGTAYNTFHDYSKFNMLDTVDESGTAKEIQKSPSLINIISETKENAGIDGQPLLQTASFIYEPSRTGEFYFINPSLFIPNRDNPFIIDSRKTDIDFGSNQEYTLKFNISIPAGFDKVSLPASFTVRAPDSSFIFRRRVFAEEGAIAIQQTFEIKKPSFLKDEYPGIKEFFDRVYALMKEEIVLKKK
ncbi:MAG: DUF3857 domain-containing protein [Chitinophagaceae bacterium]|nr:DUF3857 domain-containing protein [Chitinophagaceae bacterium]